jgi:hypothetical protein
MTQRSFTVRGSRNGSQVFVTWTDGVVSGDPPTVDLIQVEAELAALHPGDAQSWNRVAGFGELGATPLNDADSAWKIISSVLDTVSSVEGEAPEGASSKSSRRPG